eukprot:m51a1_g2085 hypothetical protein (88) ;mRNA; r:1512905-1513263
MVDMRVVVFAAVALVAIAVACGGSPEPAKNSDFRTVRQPTGERVRVRMVSADNGGYAFEAENGRVVYHDKATKEWKYKETDALVRAP